MGAYSISKPLAKEMLQNNFFLPKAAVISIYDPDDTDERIDYSSVSDKVIYVELPDISFYDLQDYGYDSDTFFPEADEVARFIIEAHNDGYDFICQCEFGESRSPAMVAAIREFFDHNGISVFEDYRLCPNQLVFSKLYKALCKNGEKENEQ